MVNEMNQLKQILASQRWVNFLSSSAVGLQLHFTILLPGAVPYMEELFRCPRCDNSYDGFSPSELTVAYQAAQTGQGLAEMPARQGDNAVVIPLRNGLSILARDCGCSPNWGPQSLTNRAGIAQKLLASFQLALNEGLDGGQRATELCTLRQMNHIVLSLFRGEGQACERAINLILSALVILLDAQASWLEYQKEGHTHLLFRGDELAVKQYFQDQAGFNEIAVLYQDFGHGKIGVMAPAEREKAEALLPMMAQECMIVFEIEQLFQLIQDQFRQVLGVMGNIIVLVDQSGLVRYANSAAQKLLGKGMLELVGIPVGNIPAPWTGSLEARVEQPVQGQMDRLERGDEHYWVDWQLYPLRKGDKVTGWLVMADDRTEQYNLEQVSRKAERFATTAVMVGALAHELRNPLTAARGLVQLMGKKRDPQQVIGYSDLVIKELDRMTRLLNEFLLLGKPANIAPNLQDLGNFVQELLPMLEAEAASNNVELLVYQEATLPVMIDTSQFTQVMLNLVRNAIEAVRESGQVVISLKNASGQVSIEVSDNGPGIPADLAGKLFQPFFTTKERGIGLGLPVTQAIVHNHGGEILAGNGDQGGAVFTVRLPAFTRVDGSRQKMDVVVLTADKTIRYTCRQALCAAGIMAFATDSLANIHSILEYYAPAIVIVDQALNRNDLQQIRSFLPDIRVIAIGEPDDFAGIEDLEFERQPLNYNRLLVRIRSALANDIV